MPNSEIPAQTIDPRPVDVEIGGCLLERGPSLVIVVSNRTNLEFHISEFDYLIPGVLELTLIDGTKATKLDRTFVTGPTLSGALLLPGGREVARVVSLGDLMLWNVDIKDGLGTTIGWQYRLHLRELRDMLEFQGTGAIAGVALLSGR